MSTRRALAVLKIAALLASLVLAAGIGMVAAIRAVLPTLIGVFAAIALLITATGLTGVIAFSVNQRAQEFGVRMALGATRRSVLQLVLAQGLRLVVVGLVLGSIAAVALAGSVRALLFDTEPTDIPTYAGVAVVLAIVALAACLMPARRASSVDPLVVLRGN